MIRIPTLVLLMSVPAIAGADCLDPFKPPISRTETSVVVNSREEGTSLCVTGVREFCKECEPGYVHECKDGRWHADKQLECGGPKQSDSPTVQNQSAAGQSGEPERTVQSQGSGFSEAAIALHAATTACGGGAPIDAIQRSINNNNNPMWTGSSPPTTGEDIRKLTKAHYDKNLELLRSCQEGISQDCAYLEERVDRSACIVSEMPGFD